MTERMRRAVSFAQGCLMVVFALVWAVTGYRVFKAIDELPLGIAGAFACGAVSIDLLISQFSTRPVCDATGEGR